MKSPFMQATVIGSKWWHVYAEETFITGQYSTSIAVISWEIFSLFPLGR